MTMMYMPEKEECIVKGCHNPRYKDKLMCNEHWQSRRKKDYYKKEW